MVASFRFICAIPNGMHARPAGLIADAAARFKSRITMSKGHGAAADAASVLSIVGMDLQKGEECTVTAEGPDAQQAIAALDALVKSRLAFEPGTAALPREAAAVLAEPPPPEEVRVLPLGLRHLELAPTRGRIVCPGIGVGEAVVIRPKSQLEASKPGKGGMVEEELAEARCAVEAVQTDLTRRAAHAMPGLERDLVVSLSRIAADPALWREIESAIRAGAHAPLGVARAAESFAGRLRGAQSAYIQQRAVDVEDVAEQVIERLVGGGAADIELKVPSVVFAQSLTLNQLLRIDRTLLRGLVLGRIGANSHVAILARSLGVPALADVPNPTSIAPAGTNTIVDADLGWVLAGNQPEVRRWYERRCSAASRRRERLESLSKRPARTTDGHAVEVGVNATRPDDIRTAVARGADGVGLLRTEMLFLERESPPSEEEQFSLYEQALKAAAGRPVIIRTFDIGGDKPASYLDLPHEDNPFLGRRGVRVYERHPDLLHAQLRAIARVSAVGPVKVMAPMIATPVEAEWFRNQVHAAQAQLASLSIPFDPAMPIGAMVEVPSAAFSLPALCKSVGFISLGTNDLCQYWMAADRGNPATASLCNPHAPSFLRMLRSVVQEARSLGLWVGVCGEMASELRNLPLMIGLGVDEISISPSTLLTLKSAVHAMNAGACAGVLDRAVAAKSAREVEAMLREFSAHEAAPAPVVHRSLVLAASDAASEIEAIQDAADLLFVAGRTDRPREIEEAAWAREQTASTALGFGFAIPHCRTSAVTAASLAVVKLAAPINWAGKGGCSEAVRMVLLLTVPEAADQKLHLQIFARLARKLMHEDFRERLLAAPDPVAIESCLTNELALT